MTAMEKVTNQIVTINNQSKARQCGETPYGHNRWCQLIPVRGLYTKVVALLIGTKVRRSADAEGEKGIIK